MVNEERVRAVVTGSDEPIVVLDSERRIVAVSDAAANALGDAAPGRRLGEEQAAAHPNLLVLFLESPPELPAYQELRAGFTAAVSHELRTPLARLLVLLESATLPGSDVGELMEQARQEVEQGRELIDDDPVAVPSNVLPARVIVIVVSAVSPAVRTVMLETTGRGGEISPSPAWSSGSSNCTTLTMRWSMSSP